MHLMVCPGKSVRSGGIAPNPSRPPERRIRRRAGGRGFSPCRQDGSCSKWKRAFSKLALAQGHIKFLTVRNLILAGSYGRSPYGWNTEKFCPRNMRMTRMNERTARPEVAPYLGRALCPHRAAFGFAYFACFAGNPCFIRVPSVAKVGLPVGRSTMPRFFPMLAGWLVPEAQASIFQTGCGRGTYQI